MHTQEDTYFCHSLMLCEPAGSLLGEKRREAGCGTSFGPLSNRYRTFESDHVMNGVGALLTSNNNKVRAETESPLVALLPSLNQYAAKAAVFYEGQ